MARQDPLNLIRSGLGLVDLLDEGHQRTADRWIQARTDIVLKYRTAVDIGE